MSTHQNYDGHAVEEGRDSIKKCAPVTGVAFDECVALNTPTFALLLHNTVSTELFTLLIHSTPATSHLKLHA